MKEIIKEISKIFPDELYLKIKYFIKLKRRLNLKNPERYNEKIQWLKLHDRNPDYTKLVDKYEVKEIIKEILGEEYIIPTLGVYNRFDDIDFDKLPKQFVIKCTHDSGGLVIVEDKKKLDKNKAKEKINRCLKRNYYYGTREWPYKNVKPRIIIEKYITDESKKELKDYKFFVFDGKVKLMFIATDRNSQNETCFDFYDEKFNHLPFTNGHPNSLKKLNKPKNFEKMINLAEKIGRNMKHVRVDFYNVNGKILFGEITFYHWSGMKKFEPDEWDYKIGKLINLSK